jgi:parvulin-like peptidyl-prolyl isomerase
MGLFIAGTIINAIIAAGSQYYASKEQKSILDQGQSEAKALSEQSRADQISANKQSLALSKQQLAQNQSQFDTSLGQRQEENAYSRFQDQANKMGNLMSQNEQLKDLFINRIGKLRG